MIDFCDDEDDSSRDMIYDMIYDNDMMHDLHGGDVDDDCDNNKKAQLTQRERATAVHV